MIDRILDWLCARLNLHIDVTHDPLDFEWNEGHGDPVYRRPAHVVTPQQHAARLKGRKTQ